MTIIKSGGKGLSSHKFSILLVMLVLFLAINPFFERDDSGTVVTFNLTVLLVLIGTVYAATHRMRSLLTVSAMAVLAYAAFIAADLTKNLQLEVFGFLFLGLVWIYSAGSILFHVMTQKIVTTDILAGSLVVYLQIGLIWSVFFVFIETFIPGSFSFETASLTSELASRADYQQVTYYSFVTLTTLGYGDLLPVSPPAQSFAFLEAVIGQIYLTVLVARLLGLHLATIQSPRSEGD